MELALKIRSLGNNISSYIDNNNSTPFIFDTGASVNVMINKAWFMTYKHTNNLVSWGKAKTLKIQGEGLCKITFTDTNITVILRKCYCIP